MKSEEWVSYSLVPSLSTKKPLLMESVGLWHILLALAIFSLIIEVFTLGFLAGALGVGLVFSSVGAYFEL
ncbi:MAG: hypothetical protein P8O82_00680, partial [Schleiferiaceae bacterium]|nr:hypothetical protein [Schleiferiaceae bacterium]